MLIISWEKPQTPVLKVWLQNFKQLIYSSSYWVGDHTLNNRLLAKFTYYLKIILTKAWLIVFESPFGYGV